MVYIAINLMLLSERVIHYPIFNKKIFYMMEAVVILDFSGFLMATGYIFMKMTSVVRYIPFLGCLNTPKNWFMVMLTGALP